MALNINFQAALFNISVEFRHFLSENIYEAAKTGADIIESGWEQICTINKHKRRNNLGRNFDAAGGGWVYLGILGPRRTTHLLLISTLCTALHLEKN